MITVIVLAASLWSVGIIAKPALAATHWDSYQLTAYELKKQTRHELKTTSTSLENTTHLEKTTQLIQQTENTIFHLQQVLHKNPESPIANLNIAGKYLSLFNLKQSISENAMSIKQIRDAAMSSSFESAQELQSWLTKAFGDNSLLLYKAYHHARRGLKLCPLHGKGYLYLADLCFLEGHSFQAVDTYLEQCVLVRPYDRKVLYEVGNQKRSLRQGKEAIAYWQYIFKDPGTHQLQIIRDFAGRVPAKLFIETFQPDWNTLPIVWRQYRDSGTEEDLNIIIKQGLIAARDLTGKVEPEKAASCWQQLAVMQNYQGQGQQSIASLHRAYNIFPSHYLTRRYLGKFLLQNQQYQHAIEHLQWCHARQSEDPVLNQEIIKARKNIEFSVADKNISSFMN